MPTESIGVLMPICDRLQSVHGLRYLASITLSSKKRKYPLDDSILPQIAIIGRPNVGKSALFNKLLRKQVALVYDTPDSHTTRDYKEGIGKLGDLRFRVVDTSGLEPDRPHPTIQVPKPCVEGCTQITWRCKIIKPFIQGRAVEITSRVLKSSDLTLLVVDAR